MHLIVVRLNQYGIHSNSFLSGQSNDDDDDDDDDDDYGDGELSAVDFFVTISYISDSFRIYKWYKSNTSCSWWRHINTRIMWSVS